MPSVTGDALFPLAGNQPTALQQEKRIYKVYAIEPLRVGLPHIRTLVVR